MSYAVNATMKSTVIICILQIGLSQYLQGKICLDPTLLVAKSDLMLQVKQEKPPTMSVW